MSLQRTITKIRRDLAWSLREATHDGNVLEITSDPWSRTHTVHYPTRGGSWREIEILHELAHAWLAETVHHLLATGIFGAGVHDDLVMQFLWPKRCAADWFADAVLRRWVQRPADLEVLEHLEYVLKVPADEPRDRVFITYSGGLICAQASLWRIKKITIPPRYAPVVDILLRYDPDKPTLRKMQSLINELAALVTDLRLKVINDGGVDVWGVVQR